MNRLLKTLAIVIWGTWFGSLVMLFMAVGSIFQTLPDHRDIAGQTASAIFHLANTLRMGLACALVIALGIGWITRRSKLKSLALALAVVAGGISFYLAMGLTPQIEHLRLVSQTHTAEFDHLHHLSTQVYVAEAMIVLIIGLILPSQE